MRVVSLSPSITELLFALGLDAEIVGVTKFCDYPLAATTKQKMGGWVDVDLVKVRLAKPDIVFTSTIVQEKLASELQAIGLNVLHTDPRTLQSVFDSFVAVGRCVDKTLEADNLVAGMQDVLAKLKKPPKVKVYVEEWPMTVSCNWVPDIVELVGGISMGKSGIVSHTITTEDVKKFDPDIIVISWCGVSTRVPKEKITERVGWRDLRAVKNNKVFVIDDTLLNRPGPRLIEGAKLLASLIR
ncbi:MAG: cobalamin-binding protein [Candidatus Woesearchaeota archaeon]